MSGAWIQTFTGRQFWPLSPASPDVRPADIAHALSMVCRYNGHTRNFYSVAEHCVIMSHLVTPAAAKYALLHDAAEAYMADLARPVKYADGIAEVWKPMEMKIERAILRYFSEPEPLPEILAETKACDMRMLITERNQLMEPPPIPWDFEEHVKPFNTFLPCWDWEKAEFEYLKRMRDLGIGKKGADVG